MRGEKKKERKQERKNGTGKQREREEGGCVREWLERERGREYRKKTL